MIYTRTELLIVIILIVSGDSTQPAGLNRPTYMRGKNDKTN